MIPARIDGATHHLGRPPELPDDVPCTRLWVRMVEDAPGVWVCESAWEPTPAELAALLAGGKVILRVLGSQPPVVLHVSSA